MTLETLKAIAAKAEATAAQTRVRATSTTPITDAVYPKKGSAQHKRTPVTPRPARPARATFIGELLDPHSAAALVALQAELESAKPKKRRRR